MAGFIVNAACRGRRPRHLRARHHYQRPNLVARLLRERNVVRFLVAPPGFGKTGLALEYAETVFEFEHTFWINGESPCFIRDLDAGVIVSQCSAADSGVRLVVFEDMPLMDADRALLLSQVFDEFLGQNCEILVTCTPLCDAFEKLQVDRLRIGANDLLLTDEEIEATLPTNSKFESERIPGLVWGATADVARTFLEGIAHEDLPADVAYAICSALVLVSGGLDEFVSLCACNKEVLAFLARDYPHVGIDLATERFKAPLFSIDAIVDAFGGKIEGLASRRKVPLDKGKTIIKWANALIALGRPSRACDIMSLAGSRIVACDWLTIHWIQLFDSVCILPVYQLACVLDSPKIPVRNFLRVLKAWCLILLGDSKAACNAAKKPAFDLGCETALRALALLALTKTNPGNLHDRACEKLEDLAASLPREPSDALQGFAAFWMPLIWTYAFLMHDSLSYDAFWHSCKDQGADQRALCLVTAWLIDAKISSNNHAALPHSRDRPQRFEEITAFIHKMLDLDSKANPGLFATRAGLAFEHARMNGALLSEMPLSARVMLALRRVEMEVLGQKRALSVFQHHEQAQRAVRLATHPDGYLGAQEKTLDAKRSLVPRLVVRLFGQLEVFIGDTRIDPSLFRRQKVKVLLALLVLNQGRELPVVTVASLLWPDSDIQVARKNFYGAWGQLRSLLSLPDGTCPYLVRHQGGCSLDKSLVESDVQRFDELCRRLLFEEEGMEGWQDLYRQIDEDFCDGLMPSELKNSVILHAREEYRDRLVDALVVGAQRLVDADLPEQALWLARTAVHHDPTREETYRELMRAQVAVGQRTAALVAYTNCRKVLREEFGIDPSPELVAMYDELIGLSEPKRVEENEITKQSAKTENTKNS